MLLLLQLPPDVASLNAELNPMHAFRFPDIPAGNGFTVTGVVIKQVVGSV